MDNKPYILNNEYSIKKISRPDEFEELQSVWNELVEEQGSFKPFLCFEWFKIWLDHFLINNKLFILLLYKKNQVVTIAPFLISQERFKGINIKKIDLIGNVYSPIRYFLFRETDEKEKEENLSHIFKYIRAQYKGWSILDLNPIPEENNRFDLLKEALKVLRVRHIEYFCFGDWYLDGINYSGEEYLKRRPGNIRENVPYRIRKLNRIGKLDFKVVKECEDIDRHMEIYYDLYSKSWQERERVGPTFHRDLAKVMAKRGWLRLGFLSLEGTPMACQFWMVANECAYIVKLFYDQAYEKYAPGKILTVEMMKYVIDYDKVKTIDYLHGDEPYKKDWTPKRRERKGIRMYNRTFKGQYLYILENKILPFMNQNGHLRKIKGIISNRLRKNSREANGNKTRT